MNEKSPNFLMASNVQSTFGLDFQNIVYICRKILLITHQQAESVKQRNGKYDQCGEDGPEQRIEN